MQARARLRWARACAPGVAQAAGGGEGGALDGRLVVPVAAPFEEGPQGPGELPGAPVQPGSDGGEQDGVLGGEPGERLGVAGGVLGSDSRLGRGQGERILVRADQHGRGVRGVQVMIC